ncbi:MAG TPA: hypothetical protein VHE61_05440 [Opitutaceae bacterium]|nr:hypothetical protein [Opitutaceae bacterium]
MSRSSAKSSWRRIRWLPAAALFALVPKCGVCLAAYLGLGALFGLPFGGQELCGLRQNSSAGPLIWGAVGFFVLSAITFRQAVWHRLRRRKSKPPFATNARA